VAGAPPLTDGERWSRKLLADLLAERYRPAACVSFLQRSFAYAGETRRARPALARQARRWGMAGSAATVVVTPASRLRPLAGLAWWGACWAMLEWHIGMVEGPHGERHARLSLADALTLLRLGLVPVAAAPAGAAPWAAAIMAGAASDAADGVAARRAGPTRLGRELDSYADTAFFSAAAWGAARAGWVPSGAASAVLARHCAGLAFVSYRWFAHGSPPQLSADTRWAAAPTTLGLLLAVAGARRTAGAVLASTAAAALATHAAAFARDRSVAHDEAR